MLASILLCSSGLTFLIFNLHTIIVAEKFEYGRKYSLPDGLELYRSDWEPAYYVLKQEGVGIVSLWLGENRNPESIAVMLGFDPQLDVALEWESRKITSISRYMADGGIIIDKDGDGIPDIRGGLSRDREIFFEGQWVPVIIKEETFNVKRPDDEVVPVEFRDGQWCRIED